MPIQVSVISQVTDVSNVGSFADIYQTSFPPNEIRPLQDTLEMIRSNDDYRLFVSTAAGRVNGFMLVYVLDTFLLLDYMAVRKDARGSGIGSAMLGYLRKSHNVPIILEVELPVDKASKRRVAFYRRHGARIMTDKYVLPSYVGENETMLLMAISHVPVPNSALLQIIRIIYQNVYGINPADLLYGLKS